MKKLTLKDIKILHPGEQMQKAILEKYSDIKEFADVSKIKEDSLNVYFHCKPYGSGKFRSKLMLLLNKSYDEIVLDERGQINRMIDEINNNESKYNTDYDLKVINELKSLCEVYDYRYEELSKVYRLYAVYYGNRRQLSLAIEYQKAAIDLIINRKNNALLINYYTDLTKFYNLNDEIEKTKSIYHTIENLINMTSELDDMTLFRYYYRFGIINNNFDNDFARFLFNKALVYAERTKGKDEIGSALTSIGLTYKRQSKFSEAIMYYERAINSYDPSDIERISDAYNNLASVYNSIGKRDKAKLCINAAFQYLGNPDNNPDRYFVFLGTYAEIYESDKKDIIEKLMQYLSVSDEILKSKYNKIHAINQIFSLILNENNLDKLIEFGNIVEHLIYINRSAKGIMSMEHDRNLINCYGEICLAINSMKRKIKTVY